MSGHRGTTAAGDESAARSAPVGSGSGLRSVVASGPGGAVLAVVVTPRASATRIERIEGSALRVRVAAPPVDGAANAALVRFLADVLGIPKSSLNVVAGASGRRKRIAIPGLTPDQVIERLERQTAGTA